MIDETEHTCKFCYYEYFDGRAYPCSMCVCGEERKDMFQPSRKLHKYGLIEKKDGEWATDFIDRKTEPTVDKDINVRSKDEPQTDTEIAKAIVHKMIDDAVIAEDAYPDLRQKMHDAVDEYEPQTEDEILREQCRAFMGIVEQTKREGE